MTKYVICLDHGNYAGSLIVGKVYRSLPDTDAATHGKIRVIDETYGEAGSEDGYLYDKSMFAPIDLPEEAARALERA